MASPGPSRSGIDWVIAAQKAVCRETRCAFWDTRQRTGGRGAMRDWVTAGLAQGDRVHFTEAGYRELAFALYRDLMRQFEIYSTTRKDLGQESHGHADKNR